MQVEDITKAVEYKQGHFNMVQYFMIYFMIQYILLTGPKICLSISENMF